jgi:choline dehydrogenase-like flavoprotein
MRVIWKRDNAGLARTHAAPSTRPTGRGTLAPSMNNVNLCVMLPASSGVCFVSHQLTFFLRSLLFPRLPSLPSYASHHTFDYVVVGGGLTGITVASRPTEKSSTTVLVIEAGGENRWDDRPGYLHLHPGLWHRVGLQLPTDYGKQMVVSVLASSSVDVSDTHDSHGKKTLSGDSSSNGAIWNHGLTAQYSVWRQVLGTSDASFNRIRDNLLGYMKTVSSDTIYLQKRCLMLNFAKGRKHGVVPTRQGRRWNRLVS